MAMTKRSEVLYVCSKLLKVVCTILPSMVLARLYSKADYGVFLECQLIVQLLAMIASFGLPKSIYYFCGINEDKRRIIGSTFILLLAFSLICCLLLYGFDCIIGIKDGRVSALLWLVCLQIIFRTPNLASQAVYISLDKVDAGTAVQSVEALGTCLILMVLGYFSVPVPSLMWVQVAIDVLLIGFAIVYLKLPLLRVTAYDWSLWRRQIAYSFPIALAIIAFMFGRRFDQMLIASMFTIEDFAVYSRGAVEIPLNNIITFSLAGLATPIMITHHQNRNHKAMVDVWNETVEKAAKIMVPSFWFLMIMRNEFIECLYSKKYLSSVPVFAIYLLLIPLQVCTFDIIFQVINRTRLILVASIINVSSNVLLSYLLVRQYGMVGAACGTVLSLALTSLFYLVLLKRCLKLPCARIFPWGKFWFYNVVAGVACGSTYLSITWLGSSFQRLLVAAPVMVLAYAAVTGDLQRLKVWLRSILPIKKSVTDNA